MLYKLFSLSGKERLEAIMSLSLDESDEICESIKDCRYCPMCIIYSGRCLCAEVTPRFRVLRLLEKGYDFVTPEVFSNV